MTTGREWVVLVHGLSANRLLMWPLGRRLQKEGYATLNWGYRSTSRSAAWHASRLRDVLLQLSAQTDTAKVHLVGHSMGAIVTRAALEGAALQKLGRVVMLAPPNRGSHVARRIGPLIKWFCPTMIELGDSPDSFVNRLPEDPGCEFGIVVASRDRVIRPNATRLPGARDYSVIASHHGVLPWHRATIDQTIAFLRRGCFDRPKAASPVPEALLER